MNAKSSMEQSSGSVALGITGRGSGKSTWASPNGVTRKRALQSSWASARSIALPGGVMALYVVALACAELDIGDGALWMAFLATFTPCVIVGILVHERGN